MNEINQGVISWLLNVEKKTCEGREKKGRRREGENEGKMNIKKILFKESE